MKESTFIKENQEDWQKLENQVVAKKMSDVRGDGNELGSLFTKLSDDVSYAQTYYQRRSIRRYLEQLALVFFVRIHSKPVKRPGAFKRFWTDDLPLTFYHARKPLYVSFALFLLAGLIGVFSTWQDPDFAKLILGEGYIMMTEENIAKGDPMAVYKDEAALIMFFQIFLNNILVSVYTFVGGLFYGVGTVGILFSNGVMVGTFQFYFTRHDLLFESFLTIWQHGATEICGIVIAGGAGLAIADKMLFPGTLPRMEAFKLGVSKGLKMLLGIVPVIFFAALVESFMTRFDNIPAAIRLITILLSFAFMIGYYVWLPLRVGRKAPPEEMQPQFAKPEPIQTNEILKPGAMLYNAINMLRQFGNALWPILLPVAGIWGISVMWIHGDALEGVTIVNNQNGEWFETLTFTLLLWWHRVQDFFNAFNFSRFWELYPITILLMGALQTRVITWFEGAAGRSDRKKFSGLFGKAILIQALFLAPTFYGSWYIWVYFLVFLPLSGMLLHTSYSENSSMLDAFNEIFDAFKSQFFAYLIVFLGTSLFATVLMLLLQSPLLWVALQLANSFIGYTETAALIIVNYTIAGLGYLFILCGMVTQWIAFRFFYLSDQEKRKAHGLIRRLEAIQIENGQWK
jgi:uncharacterized membrane protein SpoIIM required for sporulation